MTGAALVPASRRACALLLALVQLTVALAAPIVDARAEGRAVGAFAHVEATTGAVCPPVHDHGQCLTCRSLHAGFGPPTHHPSLPSGAGEGADAAPRRDTARSDTRSLHAPRPPPIAA